MREVIRIEEPQEGKKPVELQENELPVGFTHYLGGKRGWHSSKNLRQPSKGDTVYYLGCCSKHGDMFMDFDDRGKICIFKGHLNSGRY